MKKQHKKNQGRLKKFSELNVYIMITVIYVILSIALIYISLKFYCPNYDKNKSISEILISELGNAVTVVTGAVCIVLDILAEQNKTINPWLKRFLALSIFILFNFSRCAMAVSLSLNIVIIVFGVFYVVNVILILCLNTKKEVANGTSLCKALEKIHNQKILSIQLFNMEKSCVGEYDEFRFKRLEGTAQSNSDVNGILSATYKIKHNYIVGMELALIKLERVVESGNDNEIESFLSDIHKNKQMILDELKKIQTPEDVKKADCYIARIFMLYLTLENMLQQEQPAGIIAHDGVLELENLEIEKRLFTLTRTGILGAIFFGTNDIYTFEYQKNGTKSGRKYATFKIEDQEHNQELVCLVVVKESQTEFISGDVKKAIGKIEKYVLEALSEE